MEERRCFSIPKRYMIAFMVHLAYFVQMATRVDMSVALVAMVNQNSTVDQSKKRFDWDGEKQGSLLSAFYYGYLLTQFPGALLGKKYGSKTTSSIGILISSLLTLITPYLAYTNFYLLYASRFLIGLAQGFAFATLIDVISKWTPPNEKSRLLCFSTLGLETGAMFALWMGGLVSSNPKLGGWPTIFYILGTLGIAWCILWTLYVSGSPEVDKKVSEREKKYILDAQAGTISDKNNTSTKVPWGRIATSCPFWALNFFSIAGLMPFFFVQTDIPSYFHDVLKFDIKYDGMLSATPILGGLVTQLIAGFWSDYLSKKWLSVVNTRRFVILLGFCPVSLFFILLGYTGERQRYLAIPFMVLIGGNVFVARFLIINNSVDLSPRFSGIVCALSTTAGGISGIAAPMLTGYFTKQSPTLENYRTVFFIHSTCAFIGVIVFCVCCSGDVQKWNDPHERENTESR